MNNITIAGTIGRDAELRSTGKDSVASFSVADNQAGKDKDPLWWSCSLWGKRAESLVQYLVKGQAVAVSGSVTERAWTDKDGNERKSLEVRVADVALQGGKREEQRPMSQRAPAPPKRRTTDEDDDSTVPF